MKDHRLMDLKGSEHYKILEQAFLKINPKLVYSIMDVGSDKTSLSSLLKFFSSSRIDAYVYPNDERRIMEITKEVVSNRYGIIEQDICTEKVLKRYDLVLAHLILGESNKYNHKAKEIIDTLLNLNTKYLIVCDFVDDKETDFGYLINRLNEIDKFEIVYFTDMEKENKFGFEEGREKLMIVLIKIRN